MGTDMEYKDAMSDPQILTALHEKHYHEGVEQLLERYKHLNPDAQVLRSVIENCPICLQSTWMRRFASHRELFTHPNYCVAMDTLFFVKDGETHAVLHLVDAHSRWSLCVVFEGEISPFFFMYVLSKPSRPGRGWRQLQYGAKPATGREAQRN